MIDYKISIKNILFVTLLFTTTVFVGAQQIAPVSIDDSVRQDYSKVPGIYFDTDENISTTAVSSVSGDALYKTPTANLTNTLYGLLPGLVSMQRQGEPGYDQSWMTIRGIGSYNYDSFTVYVDGFQTNMSFVQYLTPAEIESISILKDAAALAPLGMKGANGAIWIVTKRGQVGKPTTRVQLRTGMQQPIKVTKPLSSYDYATLYNEAVSNDNGRVWNPRYTNTQLDAYRSGNGINTDWYDEVLRSSTPFSSADATFSGGSDAAKYFVMLGHVSSNGIYDIEKKDNRSNAQLQQYNLRSNFDFTLFNIFEGKVDLGGRIEDRKYPAYSGGGLWRNLERYPNNIYPVRNDNGTWTGTSTYPDNPVASVNELGYNSTRDRTLQANFSLKEKLDFITEGLYLSQAVSFNNWTRGSYGVTKNYARYIGDALQTPDQDTNYEVRDDWGTNQWDWKQFQVTAGYDRTFGVHKLSSAINYLQYSYHVDENMNGAAGINTAYGFQNIGGRVHYANNDKYVAEFSFAYSGSDNYRKGNRFGFYPAISGAWIMSNERFMEDNNSIQFLKIRASAGMSGYDTFSGGRYLYAQYYDYRGSYPTGNGEPTWRRGLTDAYTANPDIFAEKSMKYNLGVEMQSFNKLSLTLDAFMDKRSGIISVDNSIMAPAGIAPPYRNLGKVTTSGVELSAAFHDRIGEVAYNIGGMVTYIKDKIDYMAELAPPSPDASRTGRPIGTWIGYDAIGFYDISDFDSEGKLNNLPVPAFGEVQPGDIKYRDLNDDGVIDERDMLEIGKSPYPDWTYSLFTDIEYKGFDFSVLFQGTAGRDVNLLNDARNKVVAFEDNGNVYEWAKGRWAYYPDQGIDTRNSATYPRLSTLGNNNNYRNSNFWIKSGNFLRLRNVEIGYTLPKEFLTRMNLSNARIFVNGVNLLTISSLFSDYNIDPETMSGYPGMKSYNIGIAVGF